uniref:uncharacterized protein LOC120812808 n=1 Tax=Gasterosteus aculeatus aculeatus TaxID=481459 RepID=UPI001A97EE7E|nr:uncharacterized protein LOC120812808 [Gasterosteus aculeatus aculeatus]
MTFLVDSGATHSVIQEKYFPNQKMSGLYVYSQGASGLTVTEKFTAPMTSVHSDETDLNPDIKVKHSFLLSSLSPINLMGRDLMCTYGICLTSSPDGLKVVRRRAALQMVQKAPSNPLFVYQWWIPIDDARRLSQAGEARVSPYADRMNPEHLHCTTYVSEGPDGSSEETFFEALNDAIACSTLYWSTCKPAVSISLSPTQKELFQVPSSHPHVSLSKGRLDQWRDLGPFVAQCESLTDWEETIDPLVLRSASTGFHRTHCVLLTSACRSVYVFYEHNDKVETFLTTPTSISPALASVPQTLWVAHKYDVDLINNCQPVVITPHSDFRPHKHQYPLRQEAIDGITPVFNSLLEAGVIVPCPDSPVRTPIFPVKKIRDAGKPTEWRFVQELKAVNAAVHARAPNVPNPYTILAQIPPEAKWFSVVDLSNAFFSVPVDKDSQFWFAFNFNGKPYTFTHLCQGYTESPTIYNDALRESLESVTLSPGSALLQYVDDCLIAAPNQAQCQTDTLKLFKHLAKEGQKASFSKLQFVSRNVRFLGHDISGEGKTLSRKRIAAIVSIPKPNTKKQMMSFLGMCSYCRSFIPNYSQMEHPLSNLIHGKNLTAHNKIIWTEEGLAAFTQIKCALQTPPTLGLPNPNKPFTQTVDERLGCLTSVLLQPHGDKLRPVAYFSAKLDPVAAGLPQCLRAVAAALTASRDIVGYAPLTLLVPHTVSLILLEQKSSHLSADKSDGKPILHHTLIAELLESILLPTAIAVCKCAAHTSNTDDVSQGNARADLAAKAAALLPLPTTCALMCSEKLVPSSLTAMQLLSTPDERRLWSTSGCVYTNGFWTGPDGKPCLPKHYFAHYAKLTHGLDHVSKGGMLPALNETWFTKGFTAYAQKFCSGCVTCSTHNVGRPVGVSSQAAHPPPTRPFEHIMMDFVELSPSEGCSRPPKTS